MDTKGTGDNVLRKFIIWGSVILGLILLFIVGGLSLLLYLYSPRFMETRAPDMYLIPETFRGRVTIHYQIPTAPPLPMDGKYIVYNIPMSGEINTSSSPSVGTSSEDKYYFVDLQGHRTPIDFDKYISGGGDGEGATYYKDGTVKKFPPIETFIVQ